MSSNFFFGISLTGSFLAGALALFAPCCITFLFPSYLGTIFKERKNVMFYTLIFALGLASIAATMLATTTVLLPGYWRLAKPAKKIKLSRIYQKA